MYLISHYLNSTKDKSGCLCNVYKDVTAEAIYQAARTKYNNMVNDCSWSKVDPCDAQLLTLATQIAELKAATSSGKPNPSAHATNRATGELINGTMPKWRTINYDDKSD